MEHARRIRSVIVDWRPAEHKPTGVGHFTREIVAPLEKSWHVKRIGGFGKGRFARAVWHPLVAMRVFTSPRSIYLSTESLIVPALVGRRSALVVHDLTPFLHPDRHTKNNLRFHQIFFDLAVKRTSVVVVPSRAVADDLSHRLPSCIEKIEVIPEASRYPASPGSDLARKKQILYVGTIEPRKNVAILVKAFIGADLDEWKLIVVGKLGWLSVAERREVEELLQHSAVRHLGYVSDEQLLDLYRESEIFAYISDSEGFGLPPLEAMSQGLATVVSNDPALAEVTGDGAVQVPLGRQLEEQTLLTLRQLAHDPSFREDIRARGQARSQLFSWSASSARLSQVLRRVAGG